MIERQRTNTSSHVVFVTLVCGAASLVRVGFELSERGFMPSLTLRLADAILMLAVAYGIWQKRAWTRALIVTWVLTTLVTFGVVVREVRGTVGDPAFVWWHAFPLTAFAVLLLISGLFTRWWWRASGNPAA